MFATEKKHKNILGSMEQKFFEEKVWMTTGTSMLM